MYKLHFLLILFSSISLSVTNTLQTETLPDGSQIAFYELPTKPLSKKQLQKIEADIDSYINRLFSLFDKQSPQNNLSSLRKFKKYIDNIHDTNNTKYKISNTTLSSRILLLSQFLTSLPEPTDLLPQNCHQHIHRLTLNAHVLLQNKELNKWLNKILKLVQKLCPKNSKDSSITTKNKGTSEGNTHEFVQN